jgi:hypothetical protein
MRSIGAGQVYLLISRAMASHPSISSSNDA